MSSGGLGARAATKAPLCGAAAGAVGPKPRPLRSLGPCRLRATAVSMSCRAAVRGCGAEDKWAAAADSAADQLLAEIFCGETFQVQDLQITRLTLLTEAWF